MGFGTVVSHIILFVSIITVAAGFLVVINDYVQTATGSITEKQDRLADELRTEIEITAVNYDNTTSPDTITASARNTGSTTLRVNRTDLFLNDIRVSRGSRTITIQDDTQVGNPGLWDPDEVVEVTTEENLDSGTQELSLVVENGVSDEATFSVS